MNKDKLRLMFFFVIDLNNENINCSIYRIMLLDLTFKNGKIWFL